MAAFCFAQMQEHFLMPNLCPSWISLCLLPVQPHKCWHCPGPSSRLFRPSLLLHTDGDLNHLTLLHFQLMTQLNCLPGFSSGVYDWGWEGMHWSTYYLDSPCMQHVSNPNLCPWPSSLRSSSPAIWNSLCSRGGIRHNEHNE